MSSFDGVFDATGVDWSTVDGRVWRNGNETFPVIRNGSGSFSADSLTTGVLILWAYPSTNNYQQLNRGIALFDTSTIGNEPTIDSATLSIYAYYKDNTMGSTNFHIASSTPTSNTALVARDFAQIGRISFGSLAYASVSTSAYSAISLNSSGLGAISKTGVSKFSFQLGWDIDNSTTGLTWVNGAETGYWIYYADTADTSQDPKLVVTYTLPANPKQDVIWFD